MPSLRSLKKLFNASSFQPISREREDEIIEKMVKTVSQYDMEVPALVVLSWIQPSSTIIAQTTFIYLAPILEFFGVRGYDYLAFLNKKENLKRVLERLEELKDAKNSGRGKAPSLKEEERARRNNYLSALLRRLRLRNKD